MQQAKKIKQNPIIIMRSKCDVCGFEGLCAYIEGLDKWYCAECIQTIVKLLELCAKIV